MVAALIAALIIIVILIVVIVELWDKAYGKNYYDPYLKALNDVANRHKEVKNMTPKEMYYEGWCDGCECDYKECLKLGKCKGENNTEEEQDTINELKKEINNDKKK